MATFDEQGREILPTVKKKSKFNASRFSGKKYKKGVEEMKEAARNLGKK